MYTDTLRSNYILPKYRYTDIYISNYIHSNIRIRKHISTYIPFKIHIYRLTHTLIKLHVFYVYIYIYILTHTTHIQL